ncbi:MAG: hypothetical protein ACKN84_03860 [Candidatus Fonsibacter sp.]
MKSAGFFTSLKKQTKTSPSFKNTHEVRTFIKKFIKNKYLKKY